MAFTEFYCQSGGSNVNAGSTTSNTAAYTTTNGSWGTPTGNVFVPGDGSTPASSINVGDWVSIYIDGATVTAFIARVTAVAAGVNGGITVSATARAGGAPSVSGTARSLKAGGAWLGPNGTSPLPFNLTSFNAAKNANGDRPRVNMKNDATYSVTTGQSYSAMGLCTIQGYSSSVGDGGQAILSTNSGSAQFDLSSSVNGVWRDLIFDCTATTGVIDLVACGSNSLLVRCVARNSRVNGFGGSSPCCFVECEAYNNNKSNSATSGGFYLSSQAWFINCYSHDNTGSNSFGFGCNAANGQFVFCNCIADTNGGIGFDIRPSSSGTALILNCDAYNNTSDGIKFEVVTSGQLIVQNTNLIKNGGKGINNSGAGVAAGYVRNNGYGSGTQANGSADTLGYLVDDGTSVTYASGVTPYNAPTTGDFTITLAAAISAGRGAFLETDGTNTGTVGHPDIGAAEALGSSGGGPVSYSIG